jgi:glycine/D-amino acid oxidase-like deaminating enzyme
VDGIVECNTNSEEAKKRTRIKSAHSYVEYPASSLWPYKFVAHILQLCIDKHRLNLQTNTTVTAVSPSTEGWRIETNRGSIQASKVVYASNAFTSTLLPEFQEKIVPVRGQCAAIVPTSAYSGTGALTDTFAWLKAPVRIALRFEAIH